MSELGESYMNAKSFDAILSARELTASGQPYICDILRFKVLENEP